MKISFISLFIFNLLFLTNCLLGKDKRLALVIGNANYVKGELKNPINDARLIAKTLDSLNFEVILKENLETGDDLKTAITEFGKKRPNYDVGFVYYAGHGVQIDGENYLLPTKKEFSSEDDVYTFGVSVQTILRYLKKQSDQINILVLDACRDNPYEVSWETNRSLKGGGLAKIPPPTGSLIAFSTDAGNTAPDGDGENSLYSVSLSKHMLSENLSIYDVFNKVRAELLLKTDNQQRPVEENQLLGTFYFIPPLFSDPFLVLEKVNTLKNEKRYIDAISILNNYNMDHPNDINIISELGTLFMLNGDFNSAFDYYERAYQMDNLNCKNNIEFANYYKLLSRNLTSSKSIKNITSQRFIPTEINLINKSIELSKFVENNCSDYLDIAFGNLAFLFAYDNNIIESIEYYKKLLNIYSDKESKFYKPKKQLAVLFNLGVRTKNNNDINNSIIYYQDAIKFFEKNKFEDEQSKIIYAYSLSNLAGIYFSKHDYKKSYNLYKKSIDLNSEDVLTVANLGLVSIHLGKYDEADNYLNMSIKIDSAVVDPVVYKSQLLHILGKYKSSNELIDNFLLSIPDKSRVFYNKGSVDYLETIKSLNFYELGDRFRAISSIMNVDTESSEIKNYVKFINAFILKKMFKDSEESKKLFDSIDEEYECWEFDCKYFLNFSEELKN